MMESADVVQAIFRSLGISGWETAGMEPSDAPAPPEEEASTMSGIARPAGTTGNRPEVRVVALARDGAG